MKVEEQRQTPIDWRPYLVGQERIKKLCPIWIELNLSLSLSFFLSSRTFAFIKHILSACLSNIFLSILALYFCLSICLSHFLYVSYLFLIPSFKKMVIGKYPIILPRNFLANPPFIFCCFSNHRWKDMDSVRKTLFALVFWTQTSFTN